MTGQISSYIFIGVAGAAFALKALCNGIRIKKLRKEIEKAENKALVSFGYMQTVCKDAPDFHATIYANRILYDRKLTETGVEDCMKIALADYLALTKEIDGAITDYQKAN